MNKFAPLILIFFFISGLFVTIFDSVSASDLVENSWNTKTPMTQARTGLGVVAAEGKIYAIGGTTEANTYASGDWESTYVGTNECYNPKTDTWVTLTSMPTPRTFFAIAAYDGKIYCMGGNTYDNDAPVYSKLQQSNVVEVYDITTDNWSTAASAPFSGGSGSLQGHVVDGKIFVVLWSAVYMYDPIADEWTSKSNAPISLDLPASTVVDNKILLAGDITLKSGLSNLPPTLQGTEIILKAIIYDPTTDVWHESTTETTLALAYWGAGATTGVYAPQRVYIIDMVGTNKVYDLATDTWGRGISMPSSRQNFGIAVVDDVLYVIGGSSISGMLLDLNEQYVPIGYDYVPIAPEPSNSASEPFLTSLVAAVALTLTISITIAGFFFYLKKRRNITGDTSKRAV